MMKQMTCSKTGLLVWRNAREKKNKGEWCCTKCGEIRS